MARVAGNRLSAEKLMELARAGAEHVIARLRAEIIAIERTFPELRMAAGRTAVRRSVTQVRKRAGRMSAAARMAVSVRMKRYWAERRKARAKVK